MPDHSQGLASECPSSYSESVTQPYEQLQELAAVAAAVTTTGKGLSVRPRLDTAGKDSRCSLEMCLPLSIQDSVRKYVVHTIYSNMQYNVLAL